ncbi:unnamed protein product [Sphenostylis stenocarpa]|uniref:Uncharacterized protein n=1 Tax=Sphenostylis stenocarpa TaxID=92480 RepID=A0AA86VBH4_9FABA|nr:unnamed protein product [Sphenostylis stenocarpa]
MASRHHSQTDISHWTESQISIIHQCSTGAVLPHFHCTFPHCIKSLPSSYPSTLPLLLLFCSSSFLSSSQTAPLTLCKAAQVFLVKICGKMNSYSYCRYQEKNSLTSCEEMRMETVICPKPRRLGLINHSSIITHIRPLRHPISCQSEVEDSGVGAELLDIILPKESCYLGRSGGQVEASSPPFFCGSPPSRASNPVIQDEQFGNGSFSPYTEASSTSARGCAPMKFGHSPAAVRIEGFDCLNRDRSSCSISAVA